jgi:hypothetical protein
MGLPLSPQAESLAAADPGFVFAKRDFIGAQELGLKALTERMFQNAFVFFMIDETANQVFTRTRSTSLRWVRSEAIFEYRLNRVVVITR